MESKIHSLPPLKRFRLLQQQQDELSSFQLPAKKRKESRNMAIPEISCLLPAKKRVWALPPPEQEEEKEEALSPVSVPVSEDDDGILCNVCGSTDADPSDPIVLCDGCDLMVHVSCYGNPLINGIPDGDWFCARCLSSESVNVKCCLCTAASGAIKPTVDGSWAHLVCALYVPEVFFQDPVGRDGIDCSHLPLEAYKDTTCYLCTSSTGCSIPCSQPHCPLAFHVTCGLAQRLCIEYTQRKNKGVVHGFCHEHTSLWNKEQRTGKYKIVARDECN